MDLRQYAAQNPQPEQQPGEQPQGAGVIARSQKEQREAAGQALTIYQEYQKNKIETSDLRKDILKGLRAGEDINGLFLKAIKALSLTTHNELFYRQAAADLKEKYGISE